MKLIIPVFIPLEKLPPAISILNAVDDSKYEIHVIVPYVNQYYIEILKSKKIKWHNLFNYDWYNKLNEKNIINKLYTREIELQKRFFDKLNEIYNEDSLIWIIHEETAFYMSKKIINYKYIISIYELKRKEENKKYKIFNTHIPIILKNALTVIVPEETRSFIMKSWYGLNHLPIVLPNKPYPFNMKKRQISLPNNEEINGILSELSHKKIILYQGAVGYDRKLDSFIEAVNHMGQDYVMLILSAESKDLTLLKEKYKNQFLHIKSLPAPLHLNVTSWAYIGILSYVPNENIKAFEPLNALFCAPNKIYEYGGFGIPMIANRVPGLINTVERYHAGYCANLDSIEDICNGIKSIEENYDKYSNNSFKLFEDCDIYNMVNNIVEISSEKNSLYEGKIL